MIKFMCIVHVRLGCEIKYYHDKVYVFMNLVLILTDNTHVRIQIYQDFITAITIYTMKDAMLYHDNTLSHNLI
jgi:hypothetical protein